MAIISSHRTIGVCGIGQIGLALGLACWRSGFRVWLYGRNAAKLAQAQKDLEGMDRWMAAEFPESQPRYGELNYTDDLTPLNQEAELVVEGIAENMAVKVALWHSLKPVESAGGFCAPALPDSAFRKWGGNPVSPPR